MIIIQMIMMQLIMIMIIIIIRILLIIMIIIVEVIIMMINDCNILCYNDISNGNIIHNSVADAACRNPRQSSISI